MYICSLNAHIVTTSLDIIYGHFSKTLHIGLHCFIAVPYRNRILEFKSDRSKMAQFGTMMKKAFFKMAAIYLKAACRTLFNFSIVLNYKLFEILL